MKKIYVLFIFIVVFISTNIVARNNTYPLLGKVIYLDPGHGFKDPGAMYKEIMEKDINLKISKKLEKKLVKLGAIVYLTRYDDYDLSVNHTSNHKKSDLSRRSNIINKSHCDLFLSIHLNAERTGTWRGAQVFYNNINRENEKIAKIFQDLFRKYLNSNRKYKRKNDLYLQKRITRPGVLLELGFLSNASDRYLLTNSDYQNKITDIIVNGIISYLK